MPEIKTIVKIIIIGLSSLILCLNLQAQFYKTGNVYQDKSGCIKVIPSLQKTGVYILSLKESVELQDFNAEYVTSIKPESGSSVFIEYSNNRYTKLITNKSISYNIQGNFILNIPACEKIGNNLIISATSDYFTIQAGSESLSGFLGIESFFDTPKASFLIPNQYKPEVDLIKPYQLNTDGTLSLNGKKVSPSGTIGLLLENKLTCNSPNSVLVYKSELSKITNSKLPTNVIKQSVRKLLDNGIKGNRSEDHFLNLITGNARTVLRYQDSNFYVITPTSNSDEQEVCIIDKLKF